MSVRSAHGFISQENSKYDAMFSLNHFSIAESFDLREENALYIFKHAHDEYEFIIPLTTIPIMCYAKAIYIGEVGFCYPINPNVEHGLETEIHAKVISITVDKKYFEKLKAQLGFDNEFFYTRFLYKKSLLDLIRLFEQEHRNEDSNKVSKLNDIAQKICISLIKLGLESGVDNRRPEKQYIKNMRNVLLYIEDNFRDQELSIAKIAQYSGYSLAYFTKAFKLYMNDTPIMHLNKRRISEAKVLFQNEDLSLSEIAKSCGYKNLSTFTQAFERVMGMLPSEYRKKYL